MEWQECGGGGFYQVCLSTWLGFSLLLHTFPCRFTRVTIIPTQDRWLQLAGEETGELRVRLAVVPGPPDSPAVTQMVALFAQTLHKATTATLQVWVAYH